MFNKQILGVAGDLSKMLLVVNIVVLRSHHQMGDPNISKLFFSTVCLAKLKTQILVFIELYLGTPMF